MQVNLFFFKVCWLLTCLVGGLNVLGLYKAIIFGNTFLSVFLHLPKLRSWRGREFSLSFFSQARLKIGLTDFWTDWAAVNKMSNCDSVFPLRAVASGMSNIHQSEVFVVLTSVLREWAVTINVLCGRWIWSVPEHSCLSTAYVFDIFLFGANN